MKFKYSCHIEILINFKAEHLSIIVLIRCMGIFVGNVLLLRNQLTLNPDISEVSQEKLLSLVADRLIELNSNNNVNVDPICFQTSNHFTL